ncbi:type IV toxin-antitoxin system AbiEi family antitoxin domain-containing protein [Mycobacterium sp. 155]|uniref:type IV toxin-antitoxin system AbiEi family antitoxin domain-containing protein n=1 Tax=Mycobacterium sp. 155 TaxID=1157943 RepID=UPI00036B7284|nr:type IV toxin-antitoxin system AbiEi family antitoxin domain-containing protein [Mycobacterium sp. 155]
MPRAAIDLENLFAINGGVASTAQLRSVMSRKTLAALVRSGQILRVCRGVYSDHVPGTFDRLAALDILTSMPIVACMNTAAELYGFDTEHDDRVHILDPGLRIRPDDGLMVHQRVGAPLKRVSGRLATTPAWTAVELARTLRRPRALAILDAALHVGACGTAELDSAVREQKGRRGIVAVRDLLAHADARAESPMESEMRLVFIDWCVPRPELQYEIIDRHGDRWRVDFAWPDAKVAAEYDSVEWHATPEGFKHDRLKTARLRECGWSTVSAVTDDIRRRPEELVRRVLWHLDGAALAG